MRTRGLFSESKQQVDTMLILPRRLRAHPHAHAHPHACTHLNLLRHSFTREDTMLSLFASAPTAFKASVRLRSLWPGPSRPACAAATMGGRGGAGGTSGLCGGGGLKLPPARAQGVPWGSWVLMVRLLPRRHALSDVAWILIKAGCALVVGVVCACGEWALSSRVAVQPAQRGGLLEPARPMPL